MECPISHQYLTLKIESLGHMRYRRTNYERKTVISTARTRTKQHTTTYLEVCFSQLIKTDCFVRAAVF
jgi:hypothetical protein